MPGLPSVQLKAISQPFSESAKVVNFHEFAPNEEFHTCVHLIAPPGSRRCGHTIKKNDRPKARCLYRTILSSSSSGALVQKLLMDLASITLCERWHRRKDGAEAFLRGIAQKWSSDLEAIKADPAKSMVQQVVTEVAILEAKSLINNTVVSTKSMTTSVYPDHTESEILVKQEINLEKAECQERLMLDKPAVVAREKDSSEGTVDFIDPALMNFGSGRVTIPNSQMQNLPIRAKRSETFSRPDEEYVPYCPSLLKFTPSQLVHHTNTALLSILARPLTTMAKKDGCVYIFTRPMDPSYVKIGFTKHSGMARTKAWAKSCCYAAHLEYDTELIPHAWLVERLVQEELKQYRRKEPRCKWKALCPTKHQEWYEIGAEEASRAIERWKSWIVKYRPWGPDYVMKPEWMSLLDQYRIAVRASNEDGDIWDRFVKFEKPSRILTVLSSPTARQDRKQSISDPEDFSPASYGEERSSLDTQSHNAKTIQNPHPVQPRTPPPTSSGSDPFLSPSASSTKQCSPTTAIRGSKRHNLATTPDSARAVFRSPHSSLQTYATTTLSWGKNKKGGKFPLIDITGNSNSVHMAWRELDEGYCTA